MSAHGHDSDAFEGFFDFAGHTTSGIYQVVGGSNDLGIALAGWDQRPLGGPIGGLTGYRADLFHFSASLGGGALTISGLPTNASADQNVWPQAYLGHLFS